MNEIKMSAVEGPHTVIALTERAQFVFCLNIIYILNLKLMIVVVVVVVVFS